MGKLFENIAVLDKKNNILFERVNDQEFCSEFFGQVLFAFDGLTKDIADGELSNIEWGDKLITVSVLLFAVSTAISWSYYGDRAMEYLFGAKSIKSYKYFYIFVNFIGAIVSLEIVWGFGDIALGLMAIPNLIALVLLTPVVIRITKDYFSREHKMYK